MRTRPMPPATAWRKPTETVITIVIAALFLGAAIAKGSAFRQFEATLVKSELVPASYATIAGYAVVGIEVLLGVAILAPVSRSAALSASVVMVSAYMSYAIWRWTQGIQVPCTCFGALFKTTPATMVLLNSVLLVLLAGVLRETSAAGRPRLRNSEQSAS